MFKQAKEACSRATAITGVSEPIVEWGLKYARRKQNKYDQAFYLSYENPNIPIPNSEEYTASLGIKPTDLLVVYFGAFSNRHELETVIEAGKLLSADPSIKILLCGKGDAEETIKNSAHNLKNIILPGWINKKDLSSLANRADIGLIPFASSDDYIKSYPNKVGEYLSHGIPILSSINGILKKLIEDSKCGLTYENKNSAQLSEYIQLLHKNPKLRSAMSNNGKEVYDNFFNAKTNYSSMSSWLEKIVSENTVVS
jgi:glycosyltransferase involved in cell wall biosynthesis